MTAPTQETLPTLPSELFQDLAHFDRRSYEFQTGFKAANELAAESGLRALTLEDIFPPTTLETPGGFSERVAVPGGLTLTAKDMKEVTARVHSLSGDLTDEQQLDVERLVTDTGKPLLVADLRPHMTNQVRRLGPDGDQEEKKLDKAFYTDMKRVAELGGDLYSVKGQPGVYYTKPLRSTLRSYWLDLGAEAGSDTRRIVRLADARTKSEEDELYRRVFGS